MLKKEYRLSTVSLIGSRIFSSPCFSLKVAANKKDLSRFAFVVSKRIDKRAVVRNSLKRKIRSCIEQIFDNIETGYDFVFYPKQKAQGATREQVLGEINEIFLKNKLLK